MPSFRIVERSANMQSKVDRRWQNVEILRVRRRHKADGEDVVIIIHPEKCARQAFSEVRHRCTPEFFDLGRILFQKAVQLLLGSGNGLRLF